MMTAVNDIWGDRWLVKEARKTMHGFDLLLGLPAARCRQGATVIMTTPLAAYLESARHMPGQITLPISRTAIKRLRRLLGHHWRNDRQSWWEDRADDLADMTLEDFSATHDVSTGAASQARTALFGPDQRAAGWWREPKIAALLLAELSRAVTADRLGISVGTVGRLRWVLRTGKS